MSDQVENPEDRFSQNEAHISHVMRKTVFWVFDQVGSKPVYAAAEASYSVAISRIETRLFVLAR